MNCADIVYINAPHRSAPLLQQEPRIPQGLLNTVFMWSMLCSSVGGSETNADIYIQIDWMYGLDVGVVTAWMWAWFTAWMWAWFTAWMWAWFRAWMWAWFTAWMWAWFTAWMWAWFTAWMWAWF